MTHHAFVDESYRKERYIMCVTSIHANQCDHARRTVKRLRRAGQKRVHFASESNQRRRSLLREYGRLDVRSTIYLAESRDQIRARRAIIQQICIALCSNRTSRLVIESRQGQDRRDRSDLYHAAGGETCFAYSHATAVQEALLWVPDGIAWAWGRGQHWRRLVDELHLVDRVVRVELA